MTTLAAPALPSAAALGLPNFHLHGAIRDENGADLLDEAGNRIFQDQKAVPGLTSTARLGGPRMHIVGAITDEAGNDLLDEAGNPILADGLLSPPSLTGALSLGQPIHSVRHQVVSLAGLASTGVPGLFAEGRLYPPGIASSATLPVQSQTLVLSAGELTSSASPGIPAQVRRLLADSIPSIRSLGIPAQSVAAQAASVLSTAQLGLQAQKVVHQAPALASVRTLGQAIHTLRLTVSGIAGFGMLVGPSASLRLMVAPLGSSASLGTPVLSLEGQLFALGIPSRSALGVPFQRLGLAVDSLTSWRAVAAPIHRAEASRALSTLWSVEISRLISSRHAMDISASLAGQWHLSLAGELQAGSALRVEGTCSASWTVQVAHDLAAPSSLNLSGSLAAEFGYLGPEVVFDQPLSLAMEMFLTRAKELNLDQSLLLVSDMRLSAAAREMTGDNALIPAFSMTGQGARILRGENTLFFTFTPHLDQGAVRMAADSTLVLQSEIRAVHANKGMSMDQGLSLVLEGHVSFLPRSRQLNAEYAIRFPVSGQKVDRYALADPIGLVMEAPWSLAAMWGTLPARYGLVDPAGAMRAGGWSIQVSAERTDRYALADLPRLGLKASWPLWVERGLTSKHDLGLFVSSEKIISWRKTGIDAELIVPYGAPLRRSLTAPIHYGVSRSLDADSTLRGLVNGSVNAMWTGSITVSNMFETPFNILACDPAEGAVTSWWDILADQPPIQADSSVKAIHFGLPL